MKRSSQNEYPLKHRRKGSHRVSMMDVVTLGSFILGRYLVDPSVESIP